MKNQISIEQIKNFQKNGFLLIENFLSKTELEYWKTSVENAIEKRNGIKIPGKNIKVDGNDGGSNSTFNVYAPKATGYQARIESTTTSSSEVWMIGAEVRAHADF